ncbi:hypothetical protein HYH03_008600 [Edaphochlamys debaryana]|uniref:Protein kinase domain-containing protein n=1 Tax=Edaphochlamys debaryana TaxID=47281 RepID=A0A836BZA8_9CHLO|nr:hypothetical protein HYH03_008600 [Edaphochlamys debaryana]|eukprot:KAG2493179.1 hypothetical protein HYH03_008600 [Edaphochlamys debaryana]
MRAAAKARDALTAGGPRCTGSNAPARVASSLELIAHPLRTDINGLVVFAHEDDLVPSAGGCPPGWGCCLLGGTHGAFPSARGWSRAALYNQLLGAHEGEGPEAALVVVLSSGYDAQHGPEPRSLCTHAIGGAAAAPSRLKAAVAAPGPPAVLLLPPGDLLALPISCGGRLAGALLLGWGQGDVGRGAGPGVGTGSGALGKGCRSSGSAVSRGRGDGGVELGAAEVAELRSLAQVLGYGLLGDPQHAAFLEQLACLLSSLSAGACSGLHDAIAPLLELLPGLLATRLPLPLRPLLAAAVGPACPAVFFALRRPSNDGMTAHTLASAPSDCGCRSGPAAAANRDSPGASTRSTSKLSSSWWGPATCGTCAADASALTAGAPAIRLLALHSNGGTATATAEHPTSTGAAARTAGRVKVVRSALAHTLLGQQLRSSPPPPPPEFRQPRRAGSDRSVSSHAAACNASGGGGGGGGGAASCLVLADATGAALEEDVPGRDVLLAGNLTGLPTGGAASLVLCTEQGPPLSQLQTEWLAGAMMSGPAGPGTGLGAVQQPGLPGGPLRCRLALYLVSGEPVGQGMLDALAVELRSLAPFLFGAIHAAIDGASGGAAAAEWCALQDQLLHRAPTGSGFTSRPDSLDLGPPLDPSLPALNPGAAPLSPGGPSPSVHVATPAAAAQELERLECRPSLAPAAAPTARDNAPRAMRRSCSIGRGASGGGGGGTGGGGGSGGGAATAAAAAPIGPVSRSHRGQWQASVQCGREGSSALGSGPGEVQAGASGIGPNSPRFEENSRAASSPRLQLEEVSGPRPLELLVGSARSRLGAVAAEAQSGEAARVAAAQDMAAVVLHEIIGRGGQGVVFRGTLHGLETAVKVWEHSRGPLEHDGEGLSGDPDPDIASLAGLGLEQMQAAAANGDAIRRAKRGAMEVAVTLALGSHPSLVQTYAFFSDVLVVTEDQDLAQAVTGPPPGRRPSPGGAAPAPVAPTPLRLTLRAADDPEFAGDRGHGPLNTVLCLEYCDGGTLLSAAHRGDFRLPATDPRDGPVWPELVPLLTSLLEVALALRHMHARRLVHCDVKPSNVLLKTNSRDPRGWTCKLGDLGCVRLMDETALDGAPAFRCSQPLGTLPFMAPECFTPGALMDGAVDVYAFGMMMWELLHCKVPFQGMGRKELPMHIVAGGRPVFNAFAPTEYRSLAHMCWARAPSSRPSSTQLVARLQLLLAQAKAAAGGHPRRPI